MDTLREEIVVYFKRKDKVMSLISYISGKFMEVPMEDILEGIEKELMQRQITILNDKAKYLEDKRKVEEAVDFFMKNSGLINQNDAAEIYRMTSGHPSFLQEVSNRRAQGEGYRYNRKVNKNNTGLTYYDEELLLMALEFEFLDKPCSCRICCLLKLSTFAYEFVKKYDYSYPSDWDLNGRVDLKFIEEFEMRNNSEIANSFSNKCLLQ